MTTHLMLDIETLDTEPSAVVLQLAAVPFDSETGDLLFDMNKQPVYFNKVLQFVPQLQAGRTVYERTFDFWMSQTAAAGKQVTSDSKYLHHNGDQVQFFADSIEYVIDNDSEVWASGSAFDLPIIESLFKDYDVRLPYKFYQGRCLRTLRAHHNIDKNDVPKPSQEVLDKFELPGNIEHDGVWDCLWQINQWKVCNGLEVK